MCIVNVQDVIIEVIHLEKYVNWFEQCCFRGCERKHRHIVIGGPLEITYFLCNQHYSEIHYNLKYTFNRKYLINNIDTELAKQIRSFNYIMGNTLDIAGAVSISDVNAAVNSYTGKTYRFH